MLSIYINPNHLDIDRSFLQEAQDYIKFFKDSEPAEPGINVLVPGDMERKRRVDRTKNGIQLPDDVWSAIVDTAREVEVADFDIPAPSQ